MNIHHIQCTVVDVDGSKSLQLDIEQGCLSSVDGVEVTLDEDQPGSATFKLPECIEHEGKSYTLQVNELRRLPDETVTDGSEWVDEGGMLRSEELASQQDLIISVIATEPGGNTISGDGVVNIRFIGKPLKVDVTEQRPDVDLGVAS